jgi:chemotaxis protein MotB
MKTAIAIIVVLLLGLATTSYFLYDTSTRAGNVVDSLNAAKDDLLVKVANLEREKASVARELEERLAHVSQAKEEELARLKNTYDTLVTDLKTEIEQGQVTITQLADRLSVSMVDRIIFPSGEAGITPEGVKVLQRVGKILKNTRNKIIRVEGHTDNVPISLRLVKQFPTNWELSTARATNVVRFLHETTGIEATRLQAVGLSEFHPVASNASAKGRAQNRRIEIGLLPDTEAAPATAEKQ